jgi:hypothetical protein
MQQRQLLKRQPVLHHLTTQQLQPLQPHLQLKRHLKQQLLQQLQQLQQLL